MTFELAQQLCRIWLGNPGEVERTRWKEEWFKEGMATYLAYYFLTQVSRNVKICTSYVSKRQLIKYLCLCFCFLSLFYRHIVSCLSITQREGKDSHNIKMFVTHTFVNAESKSKLAHNLAR